MPTAISTINLKKLLPATCWFILSTHAFTDEPLPRVLIIGDHGWGERSGPHASGYTEKVRELLTGQAEVLRAPEPGITTEKAIDKLDEWLGEKPWDVIFFSFGLHDLKKNRNGQHAVPLEVYLRNLEMVIERLNRTGASLIWATTTPLQPGTDRRSPEDVIRYNTAAQQVIDRSGILASDLFAIALPHLDQWQLPGSPHFSKRGAGEIAAHVVEAIKVALAAKSGKREP